MPKARRSGREGQRPESRRNGPLRFPNTYTRAHTHTHTRTRYPWSWLDYGTRSETRSEVWQGNEASERISCTRGPRYKRAAFSHWSLAIGRLSQTRRRPRFTSPITSPMFRSPSLISGKPIAMRYVSLMRIGRLSFDEEFRVERRKFLIGEIDVFRWKCTKENFCASYLIVSLEKSKRVCKGVYEEVR